MKSDEEICAVLYLKYHTSIGPKSFCAGAVLEWFLKWALLGHDWLLPGAIEAVCCCNCISVFIITTAVILDWVELFRGLGGVTISQLS